MIPRLPGLQSLLPLNADEETDAVGHWDDLSLTHTPVKTFSTFLLSDVVLDVFLGMSIRQVKPPAQLPNTLNCPPHVSPNAFAQVKQAPHPSWCNSPEEHFCLRSFKEFSQSSVQ